MDDAVTWVVVFCAIMATIGSQCAVKEKKESNNVEKVFERKEHGKGLNK